MDKRHTGLGIASFATGTSAIVLAFAIFAAAGVMEVTTPGGIDEKSRSAVLLGLALFFCWGLLATGLGLGIAALNEADGKKVLPVLGTIFSSVGLLGSVALVAVGMSMPA